MRMTDTSTEDGTRRIGFLLLPEFSMMAFFAAIEPLRIANRCRGQVLDSWSICSEDGGPVAASNGMTLLVDHAIGEDRFAPTVMVCSAFNHESHTSPGILRWLKRLAGQGIVLGGIDTGAFVLARGGLLDGYRGGGGGDIEAAVAACGTIARFAQEHANRIVELNVNPLLVLEPGQDAVAADALVRLARQAAGLSVPDI